MTSSAPESSWFDSPEAAKSRTTYFLGVTAGALLLYLGIALIALSAVQDWVQENLAISRQSTIFFGLICAAGGFAIFGFGFSARSRARSKFAERLATEKREALDAAINAVRGPNDLVGMMNANRKQMDAYDSLARSQASFSYRTSQIAMGIGLGMLIAGTGIVVFADAAATKYSAAIVTAVGGSVGAYLSKTFLAVQRESAKQMNFYFEQPLVQSYLLSAERLVALIPDTPRQQHALETVLRTALTRVGPVTDAPALTPKEDDSPVEESTASSVSRPLRQRIRDSWCALRGPGR